jgi:hypothetical protein
VDPTPIVKQPTAQTGINLKTRMQTSGRTLSISQAAAGSAIGRMPLIKPTNIDIMASNELAYRDPYQVNMPVPLKKTRTINMQNRYL